MVKRGAGNGRVHVVLPIPFRTNSSFFALLHRRLRCGAANSWSGTTTYQENHNQPIARIYKRGQPRALLMPAAAGAPLSQLTMPRR